MFDAIALIFAFHCNHCHAAPPGTSAGGLDTSSHQGLMAGGGMGRIILPGDASRSLLMEFLDGRRAKRMPLDAPPLKGEEIAAIARWIDAGAREEAVPRHLLSVAFQTKAAFTVVCRVPARAYLRLIVSGKNGEMLHREETALREPGEARWPVVAGTRWPRQAVARVEILFAGAAARQARLHVE